jgi:protein-S-isoprenylcysteine O-methyltransferase Ste14
MKTRIKINGIMILAVVGLCAFFPFALLRRSYGRLDGFLETVGLCVVLFGQLLRASARGYKAENSDNSGKLVTGGPYAMVRNPMYLGILLIGLGIVLVLGNAWALALFAAGFLMQYLNLFDKEEKALARVFGKSYLEYTRRVPRLVPGFSFILKSDIRQYLPVKLKWYCRETVSIIPVLAAVLAIGSWKTVSLRGWKALVPELSGFCAVIALFLMFVLTLSAYGKIVQTGKNKR